MLLPSISLNQLPHLLRQVQDLLEIILLLTALFIMIDRSISRTIYIYQAQSVLLASATGLSVALQGFNNLDIPLATLLLIVILPLLLASIIRFLLARATIANSLQLEHRPLWWLSLLWHRFLTWPERLRQLILPLGRWPARERAGSRTLPSDVLRRDAEREWLQPQEPANMRVLHLIVFLALLLMALSIASRIFPDPTLLECRQQLALQPGGGQGLADGLAMAECQQLILSSRIGLLVSLTLSLTGLYNMIVKRDLISQVLGLLVMDHGLYLAVTKIVPVPIPATLFVISLYFYTLITVFILVILLPGVREVTSGIELAKVSERSNLKG